jgi:hypothetical protein
MLPAADELRPADHIAPLWLRPQHPAASGYAAMWSLSAAAARAALHMCPGSYCRVFEDP